MRRHERRDAAVSGVEALSAVHFGVVHLWTALDETWGAKRSTGGELRWERPEVGDGDAGDLDGVLHGQEQARAGALVLQ